MVYKIGPFSFSTLHDFKGLEVLEGKLHWKIVVTSVDNKGLVP
jgi:hypothetical protein